MKLKKDDILEEQNEFIDFEDLFLDEEFEEVNLEQQPIPFEQFRANHKYISDYYYKIKNHNHFNKIALAFEQDFRRGLNSFGFVSDDSSSSQEKTILSLTSYFQHLDDTVTLIITNSFVGNEYMKFYDKSQKMRRTFFIEDEHTLLFYKYTQNVHFLDIREFIDLNYGQLTHTEYEDSVEVFLDQYDLILWDLPDIKRIQAFDKKFYSLSLKLNALSITVSESQSKNADINNIVNFFENFGVEIKGLIFNTV